MSVYLGSDPGEIGDFPNSIFSSIYISWNNGGSQIIGEDFVSFNEIGMNEESSCSGVEEDFCVDDFILFFCFACNRKGDRERFIPIIRYKYRRESQCSQRRGGTLS